MPKVFLVSVLLCFAFCSLKAQNPGYLKKDSTFRKEPKAKNPGYLRKDSALSKSPKIDTLKPAYVNLGKIAGKRAVFRALVLPGWGQLGNGVTVYRLIKVGALYTGATLLTLSYIDNNKLYHKYLEEQQLRFDANTTKPPKPLDPTRPLARASDQGLASAKDTYRRNLDVIIFSMVALYGVQVIEAFVDARLMYFDVGDNLALKFSPTMINNSMMYGYNNSYTPGVKVTIRF